jgi:hypothetical protein
MCKEWESDSTKSFATLRNNVKDQDAKTTKRIS